MKQVFKTRDLHLAATLKCLGENIIGVEPHEDGRSLIFIFENGNDSVTDKEKLYARRRLRVEPRLLFSSASVLKSWIDQKKQIMDWDKNYISEDSNEGNKEKSK